MSGRGAQLLRRRPADVEELAAVLPQRASLFVRLLRQRVPLDGASATTLHMLARLEEQSLRIGERPRQDYICLAAQRQRRVAESLHLE